MLQQFNPTHKKPEMLETEARILVDVVDKTARRCHNDVGQTASHIPPESKTIKGNFLHCYENIYLPICISWLTT